MSRVPNTPDCENTNEVWNRPDRFATAVCCTPQKSGCALLRGRGPHGRLCALIPVCLSVCLSLSLCDARPAQAAAADAIKTGKFVPAAPPTPHITCSKNPAFSHIAYGGKVCYNNPVFAARGSGPCGTWCISTLDWSGARGILRPRPATLRRASSTPRLTTRQRWRARDLSMRCERPHDETPFRQISQTSTRKLQAGRRGVDTEEVACVSCSVCLCSPTEQLTDSMCARPLAAAHL